MKLKLNFFLILTFAVLTLCTKTYSKETVQGSEIEKKYKDKIRILKTKLNKSETEKMSLMKEIRTIQKELCMRSKELYQVYDKLSASKGRS